MRSLARWPICLLTALAPAQGDAPAALIAQLSGDARTAAHQQLVALGGRAVPALLDALAAKEQAATPELLTILREVGPDAGAAVPAILRLLDRLEVTCTYDVMETLAELAPFRDRGVAIDSHVLTTALVRRRIFDPAADVNVHLAWQRLLARQDLPTDATIAQLTAAARGLRAYRVELAVELLGRRGPAASSALPELSALLDGPDPRVLTTDRTVPLRRKAARAIVAIAGDGPAADRARAVLAGETPPPTNEPAVPERARARIAELIQQLEQDATRKAAAANLRALGRVAVPTVVDALLQPHDAAFRQAAITVLGDLGPQAINVVPQLVELLLVLPTDHTLSMIDVLAATAPWSRDAVPDLFYSCSVGHLTILGRSIPGSPDVEFLSAFSVSTQRFSAALATDPHGSLEELEQLLASGQVLTRECALAVFRERGAAARTSLPAIAVMLDQEQPPHFVSTWINAQQGGSANRDHTARVHRLAAEAILAIAAPDDPLVTRARQVLAAPEPK